MEKFKYGCRVAFVLLKEAIIPFVYMIIMGVVAMLVLMIKSTAAQAALMVVVLAFFVVMSFILTKGLGEKQYKAKVTGDIRRSHGNPDDIARYCKPENEYRAYKGFVIGFMISALMYLLIIIRSFTGGGWPDTAVRLIYLMYSSFLAVFGEGLSVYYLLIFSIINILPCGLGYYVGGRKIELQQARLQKFHEDIYGKEE